MREQPPRISGIVLAAGRGERMLPLSATLPKPLLPVLGIPLLALAARKLVRHGAGAIHCNLFHLPDAIEAFASGKGWPLRFHRERELLGTGGGIGNMAEDLAGADLILLHNADVLAGIPYDPAIAFHRERGALVTLVLLPSGPRANVALAGDGAILAIGDGAGGAGEASLRGYTGMAVLSPEALAFFPRGRKSQLVEVLTAMIRRRPGSVAGWDASAGGATPPWGDAGSPAGYLGIHGAILLERRRFDPELEPPSFPLHVGEGAVVDPGARWSGFCEIGRRAVVPRDARLHRCVVLDDTVVERGSEHADEILYPGGTLSAPAGGAT
jgi:mannose-1-phosphate guanylyltransferase/phosphomannomutase